MNTKIQHIGSKTVKFFITPVYPYGNDHYFHEIIAIAEGFLALGWNIVGNVDYWWQPEKNSFLIHGDIDNSDYEIAIYDYRYVVSFDHLLFRKGYPNFAKGKYHVLVDRNDWLKPIWHDNSSYDIFDLIIAGNLYKSKSYPSNIRPWAIGLTDRIMRTIDRYYDVNFTLRAEAVGYNFRIDHNMRGYLLSHLIKNLKKYPALQKLSSGLPFDMVDKYYLRTTCFRHDPEYYETLSKTTFFMAFGGYYDFRPIKYLPLSVLDKLIRKPNYWLYRLNRRRNRDFSKQIFVFQHDNFRFWEVLYSGCVAINLDLDHWNFLLPESPINGKHYVGVKDLTEDLDGYLTKLSDQEIANIGKEGREWVLENYSPIAQASRLLKYLNEAK